MLKTPKRPIWVTQINGVHFGLLFSVNPELMSDWRMEHNFTLHYYTGLVSQSKDAQLTVGGWVILYGTQNRHSIE